MKSLEQSLGVAKENRGLMYAMYFAFFSSGFMSQLFGAILPFMQEEYHLSYTLRGMLLSAHQAGNFFAVFIAGYLPYVIGRKKSTLYLSSGKAIGLLLMILTGNPILLTLAFILTGIGRGDTIQHHQRGDCGNLAKESKRFEHPPFDLCRRRFHLPFPRHVGDETEP